MLHLYLFSNPLSSNLILIFNCLTRVYVYKTCQKLETITTLVTVKDVLPVKCTQDGELSDVREGRGSTRGVQQRIYIGICFISYIYLFVV
jgi:hypothetical protein